jgi:hypothetical protein
MKTISESLIAELIKNLVIAGLGRYLGLTLGPTDSTGKKTQSKLLGVLGVGTNSAKHMYKIQEFKLEIEDLLDFKLNLTRILRKRKSPYNLTTLLGLSSRVIVQLSQDVNKGSIIFIGKNQKLLYTLIMIGMELQPIKDDMYALASGV